MDAGIWATLRRSMSISFDGNKLQQNSIENLSAARAGQSGTSGWELGILLSRCNPIPDLTYKATMDWNTGWMVAPCDVERESFDAATASHTEESDIEHRQGSRAG